MAISLKGRNKIQTSVKNDHVKDSNMKVTDLITFHTDFIREKQLENLSSRTINDHKMFFEYFTKWINLTHWSDINQCVQKSLFLDYKEYMMYEKKYASCTVNIRLRPLKAYLNWLYRNRYITQNYTHLIKLVKVTDDRKQPLSKKEVQLLLEAIGDSTYARFRDLSLSYLILDCGIRTSEALELTIPDVDFKESVVTVQASKSKTRTERILPISRHTIEHLKVLKEIALENQMESLFLSTSGERAINANDIQHNFRRYKTEAGITKNCTPYILRHTFATHMVKQGVDVFTLQKMMGHNNITTTRQYVFLDNADLKAKHKETSILQHFLG